MIVTDPAKRALPSPRGTAAMVMLMFVVAVLFHLAVVVAVHWQTGGSPVFPDAREYNWTSSLIAGAWRDGVHLTTRDLAAWSGSQLWGYAAAMAAGKLVTGGGWLSAKLALAVICASGAVAACLLAHSCGAGRRRAIAAGLSIAASPTLLLWDAWGLKDGLIAALALWTLLIQTKAPFWIAALGTLASVQACLYLRPATALFLAVALIARIRPHRGQLAGLLVAVGGFAAFVLPRFSALLGAVGSLAVQDGTPLRFSGGYGPHNLLEHPQYLVDILFGPFPWDFGSRSAGPERWLYPGTLLWIAALALAPGMARRAWRERPGRAMLLACFAYAATYLDTFGAAFYRQRSLLECMLILLIIMYPPFTPVAALKRVQAWLGLVAGFAVLQSSDLTPTTLDKALVALVAGSAVLLAIAGSPLNRVNPATRQRGRPWRSRS
ncbi:MAG TPA: hypothetical protein VFU74_00610 [Actinocrinis sp.]|nr:hypothetical protein [Actinocrinis sp.]